MKKVLYTSCLLLASEILFGQSTNEQYENYISKYSSIAVEEMNKHGIPASITLAQGILESGAGMAELAVEANNHFGIKCADWTGATYFHDDDQLQECFRKYDNAEQSFRDHSTFLTTRQRYATLFELEKNDYQGWANGLKKAGYATDPNYPKRLIDIIERFELYKYDTGASTKSKVDYLTEKKQENVPPEKKTTNSTGKTSSKVVYKDLRTQKNSDANTSKPSSKVVYKDNRASANSNANTNKPSSTVVYNNNTTTTSNSSQSKVYQSERMMGQVSPYAEHQVRQINGVKYVIALKNDSYESIAEEFGLKTNEIYSINDATRGTKLEPGEIVYIRAKKNTATRAFHVVAPDETLRDIAQKYAVKLNALYKLNNIKEGVRPMIGQRIKLK